MSKSEEHFYERFLIVHQILEMVQKHGVHFYNGEECPLYVTRPLNLSYPWGEVVRTVLPNNRSFLLLPVSCLLISGSSYLMSSDSRISSLRVSLSKYRDLVQSTISSLVILRLCFCIKWSLMAPFCRWYDNRRDSVHLVNPVYLFCCIGRCSHSPSLQSKL